MATKKMAIIATKGALDMAYPPLILASTAAALARSSAAAASGLLSSMPIRQRPASSARRISSRPPMTSRARSRISTSSQVR